MKAVRTKGKTYGYLQIVENFRQEGRTRQRIVGSLGRLDDLVSSGDLERVIRQMVEHCPGVRLLRAEAEGSLEVLRDRVWGPVLIFERLWEELGLKVLLRDLAKRRRFNFDFERMVFAQVLQRFLEPGSDLRGSKWIRTVYEPGFDGLRLEHFYRCLRLLWNKKEEIEQALYARGLDLFNQDLDIVFFDTTTTYFEGMSLGAGRDVARARIIDPITCSS